jgi:DNA-binding transcriptional ArsR family regulator
MPKKKKIDAASVFQALGDPTRRSIIERLSKRPMSVTELAEPLEITLTAVGQHLQVLEESGLVETQKVGRVRSCAIASEGFAVLTQWIERHKPEWQRRLDRLGGFLAEPEGKD